MESTLKTWKTSRKIFLNFLNSYSIEQLNRVPPGFNNNLIWNIGHVIVVQQLLVYKGSGLPAYVSNELIERYKPGSRPLTEITQAEVDELKELLISLIAKTETDLSNGIFSSYHERTTTTGFHLATVEDAVVFNNFHEGMHLGYLMSIRKLV